MKSYRILTNTAIRYEPDLQIYDGEFDEHLDEVDSLADASLEYAIEGGPGMTSKYAAYFYSSDECVTEAVKNVSVATARYDTVEGDQYLFCLKVNSMALCV